MTKPALELEDNWIWEILSSTTKFYPELEFGASTRCYGLILNRHLDYTQAALLAILVMLKTLD